MNRERRSNQSPATTLAILVAAFALLAGLYYSMRFGGWAMEGDASIQTTAAIGMFKSGRLVSSGAYTNGYAYPAHLGLASLVSGLDVREIQLYSSLWVVVVALAAFITYREFLGSTATAALGVILLFLQPDFLFYILRGSHEKYIWTFALLMLFLLARSYHHLHQPFKMLTYVGLFYIVFWAFTASNVYFAATFMSAILLSFAGGWVMSWLVRKRRLTDQTRTATLRRLTIISLVCFTLVYIFINYTYPPSLMFYYIFTSLFDRVGLLVLGTQAAEAPASYQVYGNTWRSQGAYLALTGWQWLIGLISVVAWGMGLLRFSRMEQKRWLLWLMYSAFGVLLIYGVVADFAGFMSTNMQLRMFTPFALFSSPMAADLMVQGFRALHPGWQRVVTWAVVVVLTCGAAAAILKATNDPALGNQWLFYSPAELAPSSWLNRNKVARQEVWVDTDEHLAAVYYFWEGERPIIWSRYLYGTPQSSPRYTLISEIARLRANRSGISLPDTGDQLRLYDNGTVQLYHLRPLTPYQR